MKQIHSRGSESLEKYQKLERPAPIQDAQAFSRADEDAFQNVDVRDTMGSAAMNGLVEEQPNRISADQILKSEFIAR